MRTIWGVKRSDDGLELTCLKMSRAKRPDPIRVDLEVEVAADNVAMWREARLLARGVAGDWRVPDRRELAPSEKTILQALSRHQGEPLSWTKLAEVSGVARSTLSLGLDRLAGLGYVRRDEAGKHHGRPRLAYALTGEGLAAIFNAGQVQSTPISTPMELSNSTPQRQPPLRGGSVAGLELTEEPDFNAGDEPEPIEGAYLEALVRGGLTGGEAA
jgi:DNA-binding transcriptional ArsR family regulator